jgi:hypothetical protein
VVRDAFLDSFVEHFQRATKVWSKLVRRVLRVRFGKRKWLDEDPIQLEFPDKRDRSLDLKGGDKPLVTSFVRICKWTILAAGSRSPRKSNEFPSAKRKSFSFSKKSASGFEATSGMLLTVGSACVR